MPNFVLMIDGLAGSGKDTLAENLVEAETFQAQPVWLFNHGDLLRATSYMLKQQGITPESTCFADASVKALAEIDFFAYNKADILTTEMGSWASKIVAVPEALPVFRRRVPEVIDNAPCDVVFTTGRVGGTLLYPQAQYKIFVQASLENCAHRKASSAQKKGEAYSAAYAATMQRNRDDIKNWGGYLRPAPGALIIPADNLDEKGVCVYALQHGLRNAYENKT